MKLLRCTCQWVDRWHVRRARRAALRRRRTHLNTVDSIVSAQPDAPALRKLNRLLAEH